MVKSREAASPGLLGYPILVVFVALLVVLPMLAWARGDARFSWGMFASTTEYYVQYDWVLDDGELEQFFLEVGPHDASVTISGDMNRTTYNGIGSVRQLVYQFLIHNFETSQEDRPARAVALQAELFYEINGRPPEHETIVYPPLHSTDAPNSTDGLPE